ncbi:hypothetical protein GCM10017750_29560 [Streptomyces racemochromogenes]
MTRPLGFEGAVAGRCGMSASGHLHHTRPHTPARAAPARTAAPARPGTSPGPRPPGRPRVARPYPDGRTLRSSRRTLRVHTRTVPVLACRVRAAGSTGRHGRGEGFAPGTAPGRSRGTPKAIPMSAEVTNLARSY